MTAKGAIWPCDPPSPSRSDLARPLAVHGERGDDVPGERQVEVSAPRAPSSDWVQDARTSGPAPRRGRSPPPPTTGISRVRRQGDGAARRRRPELVGTTADSFKVRAYGIGLLPGSGWSQDLEVVLDPGRQPTRSRHHAGHEHGRDGMAAVDHHAHPQRLARRHLPAEADLERRRPACVPLMVRNRSSATLGLAAGHDVAGLQQVGRPQPVRSDGSLGTVFTGGLVGPAHSRRPRSRRALEQPALRSVLAEGEGLDVTLFLPTWICTPGRTWYATIER